uniref:Uncharacterized protein n=1 Tax=Vespula pensylvanica TaxID=30213 RepID=A0A834KRI1_VESPE|nr:hypothetical protein H0235_013289 [Vespula pensylvanica]
MSFLFFSFFPLQIAPSEKRFLPVNVRSFYNSNLLALLALIHCLSYPFLSPQEGRRRDFSVLLAKRADGSSLVNENLVGRAKGTTLLVVDIGVLRRKTSYSAFLAQPPLFALAREKLPTLGL